MAEDPKPAGSSGGADLLDRLSRLTWRHVVIIVAGAAALFVLEHRDTVFAALLQNTLALIGASSGIALLGVWGVGRAAIGRMDRKAQALELYLQAELAETKGELKEARQELGYMRQLERDCQRRLRHAEQQIVDLGGKPPPPSEFGDLLP